jgi:hypothetical protein
MIDATPRTSRAVTAELLGLCRDEALFLEHRRRHRRDQRRHGHGEGVIPLVAVAATGVYVVGTHQHAEIRTDRGPGRALTEHLHLLGTDTAATLTDLGRQLAAVRFALADHPSGDLVSVRSVLCLGSGALFGTPTVGGVPLLGITGMARLLRTDGPFHPGIRRHLAEHLGDRLPQA